MKILFYSFELSILEAKLHFWYRLIASYHMNELFENLQEIFEFVRVN
jgi:hypothetical protein